MKHLFLVFFVLLIFSFLSAQPLRIMPLGDSITLDRYSGDPRSDHDRIGYRQNLWVKLDSAGYNIDFVGSVVAGDSAFPSFDPDNEGHGGWTDYGIKTNVYQFLVDNPADIILLHIGTNGLDPSPNDVEGILDEIDRYENDYSNPITVFLAKIINRMPYSSTTSQFNTNVEAMANLRVVNDGDDIVIVDMEIGANFTYTTSDMRDELHPNPVGYNKMAVKWFNELESFWQGQSALPAPSNVIAEFVGGSQINLSWSDNSSDEVRFEIERSEDSNNNFSKIDSVASNTTNYSDHYSGSANSLYYRVRAVSVTQTSEYANSNPVFFVANTRVTDGLISLYLFNEGAGTTILDKSNVNPALDVTILDETKTSWNVNSLNINQPTIIQSASAATKIISSCQATNEITIEAWIQPANNTQDGPARIVTNSVSGSARNFTLGQDGGNYVVRLRTTDDNINGTSKAIYGGVVNTSTPTHIVYTRNVSGLAKLYIDGNIATQRPDVTGDFSNWDSNYKFGFANEFNYTNLSDRDWLGEIYLSAIYNKALNQFEVDQNFAAGPNFGDQSLPVQLTSFSANLFQNDRVNVSWITESEIDNAGFEIFRKSDKYGSFQLLSSYLTNMDLTGAGNSAVSHTYSYSDLTINRGDKYWYQLVDIDYNGNRTIHEPISIEIPMLATNFQLYQNYPNPFNPTTTIKFDVPRASDVKLEIYNSLGQLVKTLVNKNVDAGSYEFVWNGVNNSGLPLSNGIYFYQLTADDLHQIKKMIMLK